MIVQTDLSRHITNRRELLQTFLPYPDFETSARCLDRQRLGKQRVEVLQILRTLNGESSGWSNHPAVRMWQPYLEAIVEYGIVICSEWLRLGYVDTCRDKIIAQSWGNPVVLPRWLGRNDFHDSHRSNLLRKFPEHYSRFSWDVPNDLPYVWPID